MLSYSLGLESGTIDDTLLKKCAKTDIDVIVMNPVEFSIKEDLQ